MNAAEIAAALGGVTRNGRCRLRPNKTDINQHLASLFAPEFVHPYPDARIEIAWSNPTTDEGPNRAKTFFAFDLAQAADFAEQKNTEGFNVYIGCALRNARSVGRAVKKDVVTSSRAWADFDGAGDDARVSDLLKEENVRPSEVVQTGTRPHRRFQVFIRLAGTVTPQQVEDANVVLRNWLGGDAVQGVQSLMRLAGTINYPTKAKLERGYTTELTTLRVYKDAPTYTLEQLTSLAGAGNGAGNSAEKNPYTQYADRHRQPGPGRTDDEIEALLETSKVKGKWHNNMRDAIATMIGRGFSDSAIRFACAPYCGGGFHDPDLDALIDGGRRKWNKPDEEQATSGSTAPADLLGWDAGEDNEIPPPREWLLGTTFCRGFASSLLGNGGVGKTAVRYAQMLAAATGRPLTGEHVFQRCRVLILSMEDGPHELRRRLLAARLHHGVGQDELKGWLFMGALGRKDGRLMVLNQHDQPIVGVLTARLERTIVERRLDLVMLDPFIKTHAVGENNNNGIDEVAQIITDICLKHNVAVDVPHHMAKGSADPGNADRGRGASALKDALRLVRTATAMTLEEAKAFNLSGEERRALIRVDDAKLNIAPMDEAKWFRLVGVEIGNATALYPNGDNIQTVEPWTPPDLFTDISIPAIHKILDDINAGLPDGNRYSDASNAGARSAWCVVETHCPGKGEGPARKIIRTWLKSGLLVSGEYENPNTRKKVKGIWVDNAKRPT
jgi:hypothetical protein